jgi:hypothetical protein
MKSLLLIIAFLISITTFSQTKQFQELTQKTKQSYLDRGYTLVNYSGDSVRKNLPLVTPMLDFDYNTYYIVLVQVDGCVYCNYEINYVDDKEYLLPVNYEFVTENGLKQGVFKFQNDANKTGKYVVFLDSDLPYYVNIFVFMKK